MPADSGSRRFLAPGRWTQLRGMASAVASRADALLDERPLRALVSTHVGAHDLSELAVPLTVTTTCLDCGAAAHHDRGLLADLLVASCSLPGLFRPVRLADGHVHVDGGVVCGVAPMLTDPRVRVLPHVADAWATGGLRRVPDGPRDFRSTADLVAAGRGSTARWLGAREQLVTGSGASGARSPSQRGADCRNDDLRQVCPLPGQAVPEYPVGLP